ncbi:MAG: class I SAM-dependent methyltransferase [Candidatus Edwardsbacteria bacterium]|jgi:SAM-dependent methyltransferase|nr:class I SAM-dependent methyltransferase [Candidatus Edwardsbacteria bacterium]
MSKSNRTQPPSARAIEGQPWNRYARERLLSRNYLVFYHHRLAFEQFISFFQRLSVTLRIVDVGCGDGFYLEQLRNLGFTSIEGVDPAPLFVAAAKKKGLRAAVGSVYDLAPAEAYDVALCMEVLEHLDDPERALRSIRGVLVPDGILYLTVPIVNSLFHRWRRAWLHETRMDQLARIDETHRQVFTPTVLTALAVRCGFRVVSSWVGSNPVPGGELLAKVGLMGLAHWLQRRTLGGTCGDRFIMVLKRRPGVNR